MPTSQNQLPDSQTLIRGLSAFFGSLESPEDQLTVVSREPSPFGSTFPSEIVTCHLPDGSELRLLCKYAAGYNHNAYGHRGGIPYEAEVYHRILQEIPISAPTFYGAHRGKNGGEIWIALEYLDNCALVRDSIDSTMMDAAAHWLGRFHRLNEALFTETVPSFLITYDAEYYRGWAARTSELAGNLHDRYPWLSLLCQRFEAAIDTLLAPPAVVIHGEYYPKNILYCQGTIYPVDWEAAAIATGELDLASLIENWPSEIARSCKVKYQSARWLDSPPAEFERRLDVAQLYWDFRWLGERSDWTHQEQALIRFERLRTFGERLGLL